MLLCDIYIYCALTSPATRHGIGDKTADSSEWSSSCAACHEAVLLRSRGLVGRAGVLHLYNDILLARLICCLENQRWHEAFPLHQLLKTLSTKRSSFAIIGIAFSAEITRGAIQVLWKLGHPALLYVTL